VRGRVTPTGAALLTMKTFTITIPAFTLQIQAPNRKEALEQFWFDFDAAQEDPLWGEPIIKELTE
jgi:hypothetical protein